jgi:uncharacterized metal-binding protein
MDDEKFALAACSGMSPYGLVARVACSDINESSDKVISICMSATAADREGFRNLIRKYPIIAVNGCENLCVNKILHEKGVEVNSSINTMEVLNDQHLEPNNVSRLSEEDEKCVEALKKKIKTILDK